MSDNLLRGKTVLVADDEKFSRQIVIRHLRDCGDPAIEQAQHGGEALALLSDPLRPIDLLVLDVMMPGVNGLTVLKAVRVGFNNIRRDLPVILLTGNADADLVSVALRLDVDAFVVKPVSKLAFAARVAKVLEERHGLRSVTDYFSVPTEDRERKAAAGDLAAALEPQLAGRELAVADLRSGQRLTRDLRDGNNTVVLPAGAVLDDRYILRLRDLAAHDPALGAVWVY